MDSARSTTGLHVPQADELGHKTSKDDLGYHMITPTDPASASTADDYPGTLKLSLILLALFMTTFLAALDLGIVATAIPSITNEFKALDEIGWYGGAYFLTIGVFSSFWGRLYKYYDAKYLFLAASGIFCVGSVLAGAAPNSSVLIVGRAIAGWGGAGIVGGSYVIMHHVSRPENHPALTGLIGAVFIFSSILGPVVGGAFTYGVTWRWCFYINLPVGGAAMLLVLFLVRLPRHAAPEKASLGEVLRELDFPGLSLILASLICLTLALQWGGTIKPWSDSSVIACLVLWIVLTIAFIIVQIYEGDHAMIPPRLFRLRTVWSNCLFVFTINGPNFLAIYYIPIYFQSVVGQNAIQSGVSILPAVCFFAAGCLFAGWMIGKFRHWQPFLTGGALLSVVGTALFYSFEVDSSRARYLGSQVVFGFGAGSANQVPMIAVQAFSQPKDLSSLIGIVLFFQLVNGCFFITAGQAIFSNVLLEALPRHAPDVNPALVLSTGAGDIHNVFHGVDLIGVLDSYMVGLKAAFALGLAAAVLCVFIGFLAPMRKLPTESGKKTESIAL